MTVPLLSQTLEPSAPWNDPEAASTSRRRPAPREPRMPTWFWWLLALAVLCGGVGVSAALLMPPAEPPQQPAPAPEIKRKELGPNVFLETQGDVRRVVIITKVVHREGQLEGLLTKAGTKEHEYILGFAGDAIHIHTTLLAAGAESGSPVKFEPVYRPASGSVIKATVRYEKGGRVVTHPAQEWIQNIVTKKQLAEDWVFGGSHLVPDQDNPQNRVYLANYGDIICLCNIDSAMMDLPIRSPKKFEDRVYHAFTEKIPPDGTRVELILEPVKK
jgi:hypothetical protein